MGDAGLPMPLGRYCLVDKLAEGGMAEVFLARRRDDAEQAYAIKLLHPALAARRQFVEMFADEGRVATLLRHPNIVRTYESERVGDRYFLCMEYLSGRELRELSRYLAEREQRLPVPVALWITEQILAGLAYAHQVADPQGSPLRLVNRDVSPTNVMLTFDGQVKLIDFGIAQTTLGFTSQIGRIKGKISYMSPEQVRGLPVDGRSDVFSAGIVLHELLSGRRLFTGDSDFSLMEAVSAAPIPAPSACNPLVEQELDRIVLRALERPVEERWPGAGEFGAALSEFRRSRGLHYGAAELSGLVRAAFADQARADGERLARLRALVLPPAGQNAGAGCAAAARTGEGPAGVAAAGQRSLHGRLAPVLVGLLLGLALSAALYWLLLRGGGGG